jgi:hypothetical protein
MGEGSAAYAAENGIGITIAIAADIAIVNMPAAQTRFSLVDFNFVSVCFLLKLFSTVSTVNTLAIRLNIHRISLLAVIVMTYAALQNMAISEAFKHERR